MLPHHPYASSGASGKPEVTGLWFRFLVVIHDDSTRKRLEYVLKILLKKTGKHVLHCTNAPELRASLLLNHPTLGIGRTDFSGAVQCIQNSLQASCLCSALCSVPRESELWASKLEKATGMKEQMALVCVTAFKLGVCSSYFSQKYLGINAASMKEWFALAHGLVVQSLTVEKARWQEREAAPQSGSSACFLISIQAGPLARGVELPTFKVCPPTSANPIESIPPGTGNLSPQ